MLLTESASISVSPLASVYKLSLWAVDQSLVSVRVFGRLGFRQQHQHDQRRRSTRHPHGRKPIDLPNCSIRKPNAVVLNDAAMPLMVATTPRARLKRPLPAVISVINEEREHADDGATDAVEKLRDNEGRIVIEQRQCRST